MKGEGMAVCVCLSVCVCVRVHVCLCHAADHVSMCRQTLSLVETPHRKGRLVTKRCVSVCVCVCESGFGGLR